VRLDELVNADGVLDNLGELVATSSLGLAGTVGDEDVRDLDAELVVTVEDLQSTLALGDETVAVDEDTINIEDEGHVLGSLDLLAGDVLHLGSEDLTSRLDSGHAGASRLAIAGVVDRGETGLTL